MAIIYNQKTRRYETDWGYTGGESSQSTIPSAPINSTIGQSSRTGGYNADIQKLLSYAQEANIPVPQEKLQNQPSLLNRVFGFLSAGETAPAVMAALEGKDPLSTYGKSFGKRITGGGLEGANYANVLEKLGVPQGKLPVGSLRGAAGLGLDILLDPGTYIGASLLRRVGGLLGKGGKATTKLPFIGEKIVKLGEDISENVTKPLGRAFIPHYDLKAIGPEGEQIAELLQKLPRNIRGIQQAEIEKMVNTLVKQKPAGVTGKEFLNSLRESLEKIGQQEGISPETVTYARNLLSQIGKEEQKAGVLGGMIGEGQMELFGKNNKGYFPREITKAGKEFFEKSADPEIARMKQLGIKHGPEMERTFHPELTVSEINKKYGTQIFEEDPIKAIAQRLSSGVQRTETANFFKGIGEQADKVPFASKTAKPGWEKMSSAVSGFKIPELENVYVPKELHAELNKMSQTLSDEKSMNGILGMYDKLLGMWKGSVTTRFPGFHIRNAYSGMFNNYILGVDNFARYIQADKLAKGVNETIKLGNKQYTYKELKDVLTRTGTVGGQGYFDILKKPAEKAPDLFKKKGVIDTAKNIIPGSSWMDFIEMRNRGALFIDRMAKGDSVDRAAKEVIKAHFDYAPEAMTTFEREVMKRFIPFYCVPEESLALTKNGWKHYSKIKIGEDLLTYNNDKNEYEWQECIDIASFEHNEDLMVIENKRHKVKFTPEHRWVTETLDSTEKRPYGTYKYKGKRKIKRGYELNTQDNIKVTSKYNNTNSKFTVEEARLLGWLLTNGYFRNRKNCIEAIIYQSPKKFLKEVKAVAGGTPRKPHPQTGVVCVPVLQEKIKNIKQFLFRNKSTDDWCDFVNSLSTEAMESMYDAMYKADGTTSLKREYDNFACLLDGVGKTFELLSILLGKRIVKNSKGYNISSQTRLKVGKTKMEHYSGIVWCPKTKNGTWVMKQDKLITITGNTWIRGNIPFQFEQITKQPGKYANIGKAFRTLSGKRSEDEQYLPEYMQKGFPIRLGQKDGKTSFAYGLGLPIEDIQRIEPSEMMKQLSPALTLPMELLTKRNLYFGKSLGESNYAPEIIKKSPEPLKKFLNYYEYTASNGRTVGRVDPVKWKILTSVLGRYVYTLDTMTNDQASTLINALEVGSGVKIRTVDPQQEQEKRSREIMDKLGEYLQERGVVNRFSRYYKLKQRGVIPSP